jgi:hypothetical protein
MTAFAQPDRDARLEARLAAYTRYAATVAEQFNAALHGDAERAGAICAERELLGEHYAELCERPAAADAAPFGALLADAIVELDHQVGIELALRQRIAALRDEALRVLHEPQAGEPSGRGGVAPESRTAAALAALDPAAVSGVMLASLAAPGEPAVPEAPRTAPADRAEPGRRRLDVRF